jgi:endonuclease-3
MTKAERYKEVIRYFKTSMPDAKTELIYHSPYELLIAVVLSAQCTDKRVNKITPDFFIKFPDFKSLNDASAEEVFYVIKSCSYPNNKTNHLKKMAEKIVNEFHGEIPADAEQLQSLPGVGRKTANVILSVWHHQPVMPVDTHVFRVSARIGLTSRAKNPLQTEKQLTKYIPSDLLPKAHHWLLLHGRYTCTARKPNCYICGLQRICHFYTSKKET